MKQHSPISVAIEKIHANSWNPNSMKPEIFEALVEDIRRNGFIGAIEVRNCSCSNVQGEHFEVIDGEHRWLACQDRTVDLKEIPCYLVDRDDVSARIETVTRNRERGEFVKEKLVKLLYDLKERFGIPLDEIRTRMMIPESEFSLTLKPVNMNIEPLKKLELHGRRPSFTVSASIPSKQQYDMIMSTLEKVREEEQCDKGFAMVRVFTIYSQMSRNDTKNREG